MNKQRWRDPSIPLSILALKLCEEAAEVGTEITDSHMGEHWNRDAILEELEHVVFMATVLRDRVVKNSVIT